MTVESALMWIAIAVVTVMSAARITRLVTFDAFPPAAWVRAKFDDLTEENDWSLLVHCGYCFSFWATLAVALWGYFSGWHTAWWLTNSILGGSYLAAIVMAADKDGD